MGTAYWPEFLLNLPLVSNSTVWLQNGYNVYLLMSAQGQGGTLGNSQALPEGASGGTFLGPWVFNNTAPFGQQDPQGQGPPGMLIGGGGPFSNEVPGQLQNY